MRKNEKRIEFEFIWVELSSRRSHRGRRERALERFMSCRVICSKLNFDMLSPGLHFGNNATCSMFSSCEQIVTQTIECRALYAMRISKQEREIKLRLLVFYHCIRCSGVADTGARALMDFKRLRQDLGGYESTRTVSPRYGIRISRAASCYAISSLKCSTTSELYPKIFQPFNGA
jgi:hypothetical protein